MKKFIATGIVGLVGWVSSTISLQAAEKPRTITSPVNKVFVPVGFDSNDDVEVITHGNFPSSCYKIGPTSAVVDERTRTIYIKALAYYYDDVPCTQMSVPFIQSVKLGPLDVGTYTVRVYDRPEADVSPLQVVKAPHESPDDFLYAPVQDVRITKNGPNHQLTIEGDYPMMLVGCMVMKSVKTYVSRGNVVVVQPIAEIRTDESCKNVPYHFSVSTELTEQISKGEYLIHVRVLAGSSLNKLVDLLR